MFVTFVLCIGLASSASAYEPLCVEPDRDFHYKFENGTADMAGNTEQEAVITAMKMWQSVADIQFFDYNFFQLDVKISWNVGDHGDGLPFDGGGIGSNLAHGFYPCAPPSPSAYKADLHFDDSDLWGNSGYIYPAIPVDLTGVAAHELGHVIGLEDTDDPSAVMYSKFYTQEAVPAPRNLGWDDILGAQWLYGRPNGVYHLRNANTTGPPNSSFLFQNLGDIPLAGDWDGNGQDSLGVYRPSNKTFYLRNSNSTGGANYTFVYGSGANGAGSAGDRPVVGDWNGDGIDTVGVYRPSNGAYYLRNSNSAGAPFTVFGFGNTEDLPIAGDWNEDSVDTIGVYRPSNGTFYMKNANNGTPPVDYTIPYGNSGTDDLPVVGDWNNSGTDTIGIYRLSEGGFYLSDTNAQVEPNYHPFYGVNAFGQKVANRLPVSGDWDGVGGASIGLFQN